MFPKPSRTERQIEHRTMRRANQKQEKDAKAAVRRRDRVCRFPLCGCRKAGLPLEVSHVVHKSMGGNPTGDRSTTATMLLLCRHRHQDGAVSIHKGTLRVVLLTAEGCDGPVEWQIADGDGWRTVAREYRPSDLVRADVRDWQWAILEDLARLDK